MFNIYTIKGSKVLATSYSEAIEILQTMAYLRRRTCDIKMDSHHHINQSPDGAVRYRNCAV